MLTSFDGFMTIKTAAVEWVNEFVSPGVSFSRCDYLRLLITEVAVSADDLSA